MPFGKDLSHLVEEQIKKSVAIQNVAGETGSISASGSNNGDKMALVEANIQRLAEQVAQMVSTQKKSKRNQIEYGLEVHALHGMRIAVTSGQAIFKELEEPLNCSFLYLELSPSLSGRQIRYIYLTPEATLVESRTEPSDLEEYIPLAMVDIWAGVTEITEDKVQDIRPRSNDVTGDFKATEMVESLLTGNVTVFSTDTGKDTFIIRETAPPSMKVFVTSGRALVDGDVINAEGGELDLSQYQKVATEYVGRGDGEKVRFRLFHQHVGQVNVFVDGVVTEVAVDEESGEIIFEIPLEEGVEVRASYEFKGNCMAVFFVEKIYGNIGKPLGIIGWAIGSNRTPQEPPKLLKWQHVIGKAELSEAMTTIIDRVIDNSYEVINLTQEELQYGEKLGSTSLQDGAITAKKISANAIIGDHIAAGAIDAAKIVSGAVESQHISAGAILAQHIAANTITADMIKGGTISADKFESSTWGDLTQAIRYVKSILKEQNFWRKPLTKGEIASGVLENISYDTEEYPTLRLKNSRQWDAGKGTMSAIALKLSSEQKNQIEKQLQNYFEVTGKALFEINARYSVDRYDRCLCMTMMTMTRESWLRDIYKKYSWENLLESSFEEWRRSFTPLQDVIVKWGAQEATNFLHIIIEELNNSDIFDWAWEAVRGEPEYINRHPSEMKEHEIKELLQRYLKVRIDNLEALNIFVDSCKEISLALKTWLFGPDILDPNDPFYSGGKDTNSSNVWEKYLPELNKISATFEEVTKSAEVIFEQLISSWDEGNWDRPVHSEGWWESPSIDYGKKEDLQAEFWAKSMVLASDHSIRVRFKYSADNLNWSGYEEGSFNQAAGYCYWIGSFQNYRYVKIKVEMKTSNPEHYEIFAYPEVRIASASQGNVGDIRFPAMTVKPGELKLNGAFLQRQDYPLLWTWASENALVISETEWSANEYALRGLFSSGNGTTTFRLPDVRAYTFRVLPEGHSDDSDRYRRMGCRQNDAMQNATGGFTIADGAFFGSAWGVYSLNGQAIWARGGDKSTNSGVNFNLANVVRTSSETRMKNVAYFACIRYS